MNRAGGAPTAGLVAAGLGLLVLLGLAYGNHFDNDFAFDDAHTIQDNAYIRDLGNIPRFFVDATTHSSSPANQAYRPLLSASFALDYWLAGSQLDPFWFHAQTFAWYLAQQLLLFLILVRLFEAARPHRWNRWVALLATAFYAFHTANAETLNYIYARSDSLSTFWALLAFLMYLRMPHGRRGLGLGVGLYLLPLAVGLFVKQALVVFPGLVFLYEYLLRPGPDAQSLDHRRRAGVAAVAALPSLVLCVAFFLLQARLTPGTYDPGGASRWDYLVTQPFVVLHYAQNFVLPAWLSADTDFTTFKSVLDWRCLLGFAFVGGLLAIAWVMHRKHEWRPVAFGILWFGLTLAPSSSFIPWAEVTNDHRTFWPYIGLVIALAWAIALHFQAQERSGRLDPLELKLAVLLCLIVIGVHGAGAHARNEVWHDSLSLWSDVTQKSPGNGRGWMNYGVALMGKGDFAGAENAFLRAQERLPDYSYVFVNLGIAAHHTGRPGPAEAYFRRALELAPGTVTSYYFYARFLDAQGRTGEATGLLETGLRLSPGHIDSRHLLLALYAKTGHPGLGALAQETLAIAPGDPVARGYLGRP